MVGLYWGMGDKKVGLHCAGAGGYNGGYTGLGEGATMVGLYWARATLCWGSGVQW